MSYSSIILPHIVAAGNTALMTPLHISDIVSEYLNSKRGDYIYLYIYKMHIEQVSKGVKYLWTTKQYVKVSVKVWEQYIFFILGIK